MVAISVVMPLYNKASYVRTAVTSILAQLATNDELIIVDDCSTDLSLESISDLTHRNLKILQTPNNCGPANARNIGASNASNPFLLFFDADDIPVPYLVSKLKDTIRQHPGEDLFSYRIIFSTNRDFSGNFENGFLRETKVKIFDLDFFAQSCLNNYPICTASSTCVSASAFHKAGGFKDGLRYCEDPELWVRLSAVHKLVYIDLPLAVYRDVANSLSYEYRGKPGAIAPYINTLIELGKSRGAVYMHLARQLIAKNVVFSLASDADRVDLVYYLYFVRDYFSAPRLWLLRLTTVFVPGFLVRTMLGIYTGFRIVRANLLNFRLGFKD
jgi:glycosyltransferase involved in cell wall biosynthesis